MNQGISMLMQAMFQGQVRENGIAIDIGAHHGVFSKALLETAYFQKVISFEPSPSTFAILRDQLSAIEERCSETVNMALGNQAGSFSFYSNSDSATSSLLPYVTEDSREEEIRETKVRVETLDGYLATRPDIESIKLLKIDTQGNDLAVLQGGRATLAKHKPIIQVELIFVPLYKGQCSADEIKAELAEQGYQLYSLGDIHITKAGQLAFCDAIFVSRENVPLIDQEYICIDDHLSYQTQIATLNEICAERLSLINRLSEELASRAAPPSSPQAPPALLQRITSWLR